MIYIGSDHRGFQFKEKVKQTLVKLGYEYEDVGPTDYNKEDDYPDFAEAVSRRVMDEKGNRGILICGSGIGVCITANKIKGIRAGTMSNAEQTIASVSDEDTNVLCLSADFVSEEKNIAIIKAFIETKFSEEERHVRRVEKIKKLEE